MKIDNEKFFEELATAYVNQEGEKLKKEIPKALNLPTERLDGKVKQALKGSSKENLGRKRKNRAIALSTMAAVFVMFLIYTAIIPTMNRQNEAWPAAAPEWDGAPEAAAVVEEAEDMDAVMDWAEAEEAPADIGDEDAADAADDDLDFYVVEEDVVAEPVEPIYFAGIFTDATVIDQFEAALPEGYQIRERYFHDDSTQLQLYSATHQPILLTERPEETFGRELYRNAEILEVSGVEVLQRSLPDGEVQLDFQTMGSHFAILGLDAEELMVVARAVIDFPELSDGDGPWGDDREVDVSEQIELIPLPRGLITIVPVK